MILLCCENIASTALIDWKTLVPLVSPIVVILLFIIDRIIGYNLRKKEAERSWYLKILIEPSIEKISQFYKETIENYKLSANLLKTNHNLPHTDYISIKAKEFGKFQITKRDLETDVFAPIQFSYPTVGELISEDLRNLEDDFTVCLDLEKFSDDDLKDFQLKLASNKAILLKHLYSPINKK